MKKIKVDTVVPGSFRDPAGHLFFSNGSIYRQINKIYKENYDNFMDSGLYGALVESGLLIPHEEAEVEFDNDEKYKILKPEQIAFISYPYEWCFSQLKDAALTTLKIQKVAISFGMSLKDCSSYNIQFKNGKPVFIDTLSFEIYREGEPWVAYKQFCQHFFAPLALNRYTDIRLSQLFRVFIDGIPLDLASKLLPFRTRFKPSIFSHIHLHAKSQAIFADKTVSKSDRQMRRISFLGLIDNLESAIKKFQWKPKPTEWGDYYEDTNYSSDAFKSKKQIVAQYMGEINPKHVWDLGANVGLFSRITSNSGIPTISFDIDPVAVERNYLECTKSGETHILPLLLDLTNPSPGIGWDNKERSSLIQRCQDDTVLALALIHHLAISNNLPFNKIAFYLSSICKSLIIEFVPKCDTQVQKLLSTREDIFPDYRQRDFENEFKKYFNVKNSMKIRDSDRTLFLMKRIST